MTARSSVHTFAIYNELRGVGVFVAVIFSTLTFSAVLMNSYKCPDAVTVCIRFKITSAI